MTLPITLIGGYLGAGKTTLVNHLLRHANGLRLAILVNEFGALPIDQDLIEAQDDNIISIAGGCVCCSYGNDLTLALMELVKLDPLPDHVVLEASGVALPGAIAASVTLLPGYSLDGIVILANAETIREQAADTYIGDTITRQLACADLLVINKTDLVPAHEQQSVVGWMRERVNGADIVAAEHGRLPTGIVLQSFLEVEHADESPTHQPGLFETISLPVNHPVDADALARRLAEESTGVIRAKGFVSAGAGNTQTIQLVGRRWAVTAAPAGVQTGLVVIGQAANLDVEALQALPERCRLT